ncbi:MAG: Gfo/Idh/MocA family oxidoreductase [Acidobacteria bacterium]|nr:Gfo/Idh/MocA family oxidoreductase [Acidobacteriota bacterium]
MTDHPTENRFCLGLIGFGRLAQDFYFPVLRKLKCLPVAVADPAPESRKMSGLLLPRARVYTSWREMLEGEELDAMLVASPPSTHLEIWKKACSLKLPVFMEKPFLLPGQLSEVEWEGVHSLVMIDFCRRFWPVYQQVKNILLSGEIGLPQRAEFRMGVNLEKWSPVSSYRENSSEGGVLCDLGSHAVDLLWEIFSWGEKDGDAEIQTWELEMSHAFLSLWFSKGVRCDVHVSYGPGEHECLRIEGTLGTLSVPHPCMALREGKGALGRESLRLLSSSIGKSLQSVLRWRSVLRACNFSAMSHFLSLLSGGQTWVCGLESGILNTRSLAAAQLSKAAGRRVRLSEVTAGLSRSHR